MTTLQELTSRAQTVRDETQAGRNTAQRVGSLLNDIILFLADLDVEKQDITDNSLATDDKTIPGAINEVKYAVDEKQNAADENLLATDKTIVGAINENFNHVTSLDINTNGSIQGLYNILGEVYGGGTGNYGSGHVVSNDGVLGIENPERFAKFFTNEWGSYSMAWIDATPGCVVNSAIDGNTGNPYEFLRVATENTYNSPGLVLAQSNTGSTHSHALVVSSVSPRIEANWWDSNSNQSMPYLQAYSGRFAVYSASNGNNYDTMVVNNGNFQVKIDGNNTLQVNDGNIQAHANNIVYFRVNPSNIQGIDTPSGNNYFQANNAHLEVSNPNLPISDKKIFFVDSSKISGFVYDNTLSQNVEYFKVAPAELSLKNGGNKQIFQVGNGNLYLNNDGNSPIFSVYSGNIQAFTANSVPYFQSNVGKLQLKNSTGNQIFLANEGGIYSYYDDGFYQKFRADNYGMIYCSKPNGTSVFYANDSDLQVRNASTGTTVFSVNEYGMNFYNKNSGNAIFQANSSYLNIYGSSGLYFTASNDGVCFGKYASSFQHEEDGYVSAGVRLPYTRTMHPLMFGSAEMPDAAIYDNLTQLFVDGTDLKVKVNIGGVIFGATLATLTPLAA
jgi:hypothetical protein